uniref:Uncharacterized protein n=1 Tax=Anguilla anguilla TaxID=7936 RepID=A0A0E9REE3_ANGAN
MSHNNVIVVT